MANKHIKKILSCKGNSSQNDIEISFHPSQNDYDLENKQQMLVRMLGKWNPHTLLMGMSISAATVGFSVEVPYKTKTELPGDPAITSWAYI
jgi:hypothetical protein